MFMLRSMSRQALAAVLLAVLQPVASGQTPTWSPMSLVSVGTDGTGGNNVSGNDAFGQAIPPRTRVSADGRFVVFESAADNLICSPTQPWADIFVRDRLLGTTTLVSISSGGVPGNQHPAPSP